MWIYSSIVVDNARKEPTHPKPIDILWSNGPQAIRFIIFAMILWVPYHCRTVINTFFWLAIISRSGRKRFRFPTKLLLPQVRHFLKIGSVDSDAPTVSIAIKVVILNQNFSEVGTKLCKLTRPEQQTSGRSQTQLRNGWTVRCNQCLPNASAMNKITGHNSYRMSWWHIVPRFMNPQGTLHIFLFTDRKSAFVLISRTQIRVINPQSTSMNLCLPDSQISKSVRFGSYSPDFQSATQKRHLQSKGPWTQLSSQSKSSTTQPR